MNGSQDFYLDWNDYVHGFGNLNGEFWLLSKIHCLTANTSHTSMLRVDLGDFDANTAYAKYSTFRVGDTVSKYILTVSGYTRTAGDSLANGHNGHRFSTRDQDNDAHTLQKQSGCFNPAKGLYAHCCMGSELATEITLAGLKQPFCFCSVVEYTAPNDRKVLGGTIDAAALT